MDPDLDAAIIALRLMILAAFSCRRLRIIPSPCSSVGMPMR